MIRSDRFTKTKNYESLPLMNFSINRHCTETHIDDILDNENESNNDNLIYDDSPLCDDDIMYYNDELIRDGDEIICDDDEIIYNDSDDSHDSNNVDNNVD